MRIRVYLHMRVYDTYVLCIHMQIHIYTHTHFHRRCFFLFLPFLLFSAFLMGKRHIYFENTAQKIHHTHHTNKELT